MNLFDPGDNDDPEKTVHGAPLSSVKGVCMMKRSLAVFLAAVLLIAHAALAARPPGPIAERKNVRAAGAFDLSVRGLVLKFDFTGVPFNMYQTMASKDREMYQAAYKKSAPEYLAWLQNTYDKLPSDLKTDLAVFFGDENLPHHVIWNSLAPLPDDASPSEIMAKLRTLALSDDAKRAAENFLPRFYESYLRDYRASQVTNFERKARALNDEAARKDPDILGFMEKVSGIPFKRKSKPRFYYTLQPIGAQGFEYDGLHVSTIQPGITSIDDCLGTAFHEYSHPLLRSFTRTAAFAAAAEKMKKDPTMVDLWEKEMKRNYDWIGWCEENLVEGFGKFLSWKYSGKLPTRGFYPYDLEFFEYLRRIDFNPSRISLEDASIAFYVEKAAQLK